MSSTSAPPPNERWSAPVRPVPPSLRPGGSAQGSVADCRGSSPLRGSDSIEGWGCAHHPCGGGESSDEWRVILGYCLSITWENSLQICILQYHLKSNAIILNRSLQCVIVWLNYYLLLYYIDNSQVTVNTAAASAFTVTWLQHLQRDFKR